MDAVAFLKRMHPQGPWVLTAINPDRKGIETRTFRPGGEAKAQAWIEGFSGRWNLYFSVNRAHRDLTTKASRKDIAEIAYLHVDVDPRANEPLEAEQARILELLTNARPQGLPEPTVIVFSGGGYQAFWQLEEPLPAAGNAELLTRYNMQLEADFGGDNCHNIDRIMRLPGTMNVPDAKKAKKGRVRAMARVVADSGQVYSLDSFTPAPAAVVSEPDSAIDWAKAERLASVEDLAELGVPDRVQVIIVQGHHPDETKPGDNSRSAWMFDAVCQLVRCEVPDPTIYSIITDPDFKISECVLDKGSGTKEYALRQVRRAHEEVADPDLRAMNDRHCVVLDFGGKTRVITEKRDNVLDRRAIAIQHRDDFFNRYAHRTVTVDGKAVNRGKWWFRHPMRRQVESLVYLPGEYAPGDLNLWQGFAVTARAGTLHEGYLAHIRENICSGRPEHYQYLVGWLARAVQSPNKVGEVAIVLRGGRGTGKSFFGVHFGHLWGQHFLHVADAKHLVGSFNAHLRDCSVLFADEAFWAGDKRREGMLKALVTEQTIMIEHKGVDAHPARNLIHLIMASNEGWVVPAGPHERRFFVLDVGIARQKDTAYFRAIDHDLKAGGYENLLHFLLGHDLSSFDVRAVPWTEALTDQVERKMGPAEELVLEALKTGRLPVWRDEANKNGRAAVAAWDFVPQDLKDRNEIEARRLARSVGWVLRGIVDPEREARSDRLRQRWLPEPAEARAKWAAKYGYEIVGGPKMWLRSNDTGSEQTVIPFSENGGRNGSCG